MKNSAYYKCVNVSIEPMPSHLNDESKYCAVPGYTFLKPGSHRVHVMMKNLTVRTVTIQQGVKIATMSAANVVPHMLAPEEVKVKLPPKNPENGITILIKSASVGKDGRCSSIEGDTRGSTIESPRRPSTIKDEKPELD